MDSVFLDRYLPADGFIAATPIYWYGTSAQLKAFFDRTFCYYAASYPKSEDVIRGMSGKRIGLVLSSEETFPMVSGAVLCQIQEFSRYTRSTFVGVVHGYGNARGDVLRDPNEPMKAARRLGKEFFTRHASNRLSDRYGSLRPRLGLSAHVPLRTAVPAVTSAMAVHCVVLTGSRRMSRASSTVTTLNADAPPP